MKRIAKFEKVSFEQYLHDYCDTTGYCEKDEEVKRKAREIYDSIKLPVRATSGSAGYDFFAPVPITLKPGETEKIPTGIRVKIEEDWVLFIVPRSSLGFKYRMQLDNTIGVIDSDYYGSKNEGHCFIKITNDSYKDKIVQVEAGNGFAQGIFLPYGITEDDNVTEIRDGGFGSTTR